MKKLSIPQQEIYFDHIINPENPKYNVAFYLSFQGNLQVDALSSAISKGLQAFDSFKIHRFSKEQPRFEVMGNAPSLQLEKLDFSSKDRPELDAKIWMQKQMDRPCDIQNDTLYQFALLKISKESYWFFNKYHHLIIDGHALFMFNNYVCDVYKQLSCNQHVEVHKAPSYFPFIDTSVTYEQSEQYQEDKRYWNKKLAQRSQDQEIFENLTPSLKCEFVDIHFSQQKQQEIKAFCADHKISLQQIILLTLSIYHFKTSNSDFFECTVPIRNRNSSTQKNTMGLFSKMIPFSVEKDDAQPLFDLVKKIRGDQRRDYRHLQYPISHIKRDLYQLDSKSNNRFDTFVSYKYFDFKQDISGATVTIHEMESSYTQAPLEYACCEFGNNQGFYLRIKFDTGLYSRALIKLKSQRILHIIDLLMIADESTKVADIDIIPREELHTLLKTFNDTRIPYDETKNVIDLFSLVVDDFPARVAVVHGKEILTFQELDVRSNQLAKYLCKEGIQFQDNIGLLCTRRIDMIIGIIGILKAGGVYVPLNKEYPKDRLEYILKDAKISCIVYNDQKLIEEKGLKDVQTIAVTESLKMDAHFAVHEKKISAPAYIMYTSGTTGNPKGILVPERSILKLVHERGVIKINSDDRVVQWSNFAFDGCIYEIFCSLLNGAELHMIDDGTAHDARKLSLFLKENQITVGFFTTALFNNMVEFGLENLKGLRKILFGGELVSVPHVQKALDMLGKDVIVHVYGPTETAVYASFYPVNAIEGKTVPIGKGLDNTSLYVLSDSLQAVPIGETGELFIGGHGLALEYLNKKELTDLVFIENPFRGEGKLYKTGDLVRWNVDGAIEFIGRKDFQVKIRGYRIELGEIETQLGKIDGIDQAIVVVKEDNNGNKRLVAYVIADEALNPQIVVKKLGKKLPDYMVPQLYVILSSFPLNKNGKIDKRALPEPDLSAIKTNNHEPPTTSLEKKLATIWEQLLDISNLGIHNNFFMIGGHSLLASRLVAKIQEKLKIDIDIRTVFLFPTIAKLSEHIMNLTPVRHLDIPKRDSLGKPPLSFAQERLWFIDTLEGSSHYHVPIVLDIEGILDLKLLESCLKAMIERHQALRTVFKNLKGEAYQEVLPSNDFKIHVDQAFLDPATNTMPKAIIDNAVLRSFDLSKDYMLRASLFEIAPSKQTLVLVFHHIAFDGWSLPIFLNELEILYAQGANKCDLLLSDLPIQYTDYSIWQRERFAEDHFTDKLNFWELRLQGVEPLLLPTDYTRPAVQQTAGKSFCFDVSQQVVEQLQILANRYESTLFMILLSLFKILLFRYTHQKDICVGIPTANREQSNVTDLIGLFVNTIALRTTLHEGLPFDSLLKQVRDGLIEGYAHQDVPFEQIVNRVVKSRDQSRTPIFQVMFNLQNEEFKNIDLDDNKVNISTYYPDTAKFDLEFDITKTNKGLSVRIEYCTALFKGSTIERMSRHYMELIQAVTIDPSVEIGDINMIPESEQRLLLDVFNDTEVSYEKNETVLDLFSKQVLNRPNEIAVVFENRAMTYSELDQRSNQLAHHLMDYCKLKSNDFVMVALDRNDHFLMSVIAIWKAGGAYIPIANDYPENRIITIASQADAKAFISSKGKHDALLDYFDTNEMAIIYADSEFTEVPTEAINKRVRPEDLSYIIFTSGSTGKPKGVMIEHQGMLNHLYSKIETLELDESSVVAQNASVSFDISVWQFFAALMVGGTTIIYDQELIMDPVSFAKKIKEDGVTILEVVPSYLALLLDNLEQGQIGKSTFEELAYLMVTGETILPTLANRWVAMDANTPMVNAYGPTEASDDITHFFIDRQHEDMIPIGTPVRNMKVYVLSKRDKLTGIGIKGEICVSGIGVGRGYLNEPDKTSKSFVDDPFRAGIRMYRTGDIGRVKEDGVIEFFGRNDFQVKIHGYRIELGEIENALLHQKDLIKEAVVDIRKFRNEKVITAYIVPSESFSNQVVTSRLQKRLPHYMLPSYYVEMEYVPLTLNGKVNRKVLAEIPINVTKEQKASEVPRNENESLLAGIWQELLAQDSVGIDDNFFELGGDSIIAIQVVSRAKAKGLQLRVKDVFAFQTIRELTTNTEINNGAISEQGILTGAVGLLPVQQYFFDKHFSDASHYNQAMLLNIDRIISVNQLEKVVDVLTQTHDSLRLRFEYQDDRSVLQQYHESSPATEIVDLRQVDNFDRKVINLCQYYQKNLSIENNELIKFVLILSPDTERQNRLFIVAHHTLIDGVSWRIILDDMADLLLQVQNGKEISIKHKTSSYRQWHKALISYAKSAELQAEVPYWERIISKAGKLRTFNNRTTVTLYKDVQEITLNLDKATTQDLVKSAHLAYSTDMNDLLLTALSLSLNEWCNTDYVQICLEGHGREELFDDIDLSQTTGWFTSMFPVILEATPNDTIENAVVKIKETLRMLPCNGIGYGVLRYLSDDLSIKKKLNSEIDTILFNFLGNLDVTVKANNILSLAEEITEEAVGKYNEFPSTLEINAYVKDNKLHFLWQYDPLKVDVEEINEVAGKFVKNLENITSHCVNLPKKKYTPSDYDLTGEVTMEVLQSFQDRLSDMDIAIEDIVPLSPMQKGILFHSIYDMEAKGYVNQLQCSIDNELLVDIFLRSWEYIFNTHSILRTSFYPDHLGIPVQIVHEKVDIPILEKNLRNMNVEAIEDTIEKILQEDRRQGFDLGKAPLLRFTIIHLPAGKSRLIITNHGIISDGWSQAILFGEFITYYNNFAEGKGFPEIWKDDYRAFVSKITKKTSHASEAYWKNYLSPIESPSFLPFIEKQLVRNKIFSNTSSTLTLTKDLAKKIYAFTQANQITINTLLQGVWGYLLSQYTQNENVTYGVAISGRDSEIANIEKKAGLFINTIPIVIDVKNDNDIPEWLRGLQSSHAVGREEHGHLPLNTIQNLSPVKGTLFDSLLVFENYPMDNFLNKPEGALKVTDLKPEEYTNFTLTIAVILLQEFFRIDFVFNPELISTKMVKMIQGHFKMLLESMVQDEQSFEKLNYLSISECTQLLDIFNNTEKPYSLEETFLSAFDRQVQKTPEHIAVVFERQEMSFDTFETQQMTYKELDEVSNQLAHELIAKGMTRRQLIPICLERSLDMIVSVLGVLKAGGAYVPIDASYPKERVDFIIEDTKAKLIISQNELSHRFKEHLVQCVNMNDRSYESYEVTKPQATITPEDVANVIYTSGTTGKPKGVLVSHQGIFNLAMNQIDRLQITNEDRVLQFASFAFDAFGWELFSTLLAGSQLVITSKNVINSIDSFVTLINNREITMATLPPSYQTILQEHDFHTLRTIVSAGEPLNAPVAQYFIDEGIQIVNAYGPTENTVCISMSSETPILEDGSVTIGKPLNNVRCYILGMNDKLCPVGVTGELCVSGRQVAKGYLNRPSLTEEKFVRNPFATIGHETLYRTGDLAQWLPDGNIAFVGRADQQVKIRGHRIELGEIETQLESLPAIDQAVVMVKEDSKGSKSLVAYVVGEYMESTSLIQEKLAAKLPEYMVPRQYVSLDFFPINSNGKIDRDQLVKPENFVVMGSDYVAPSTEEENILVTIWKDLLDSQEIGIQDNFFELGGDSIKALQLVARAKSRGLFFKVKDVFSYQNIQTIAANLQTESQIIITEEGILTGTVPLGPIQREFLSKGLQHQDHYNQSILIEIKKDVDINDLNQAVQSVVSHHDMLRLKLQFSHNSGAAAFYGHHTEKVLEETADSLEEIPSICGEYQRTMDLEKGEIVKFIKICTPGLEIDHLFIVAHHMSVDGVSWRIILEDLQKGLLAVARGEQIDLGSKMTSFRQWQKALSNYRKELLQQEEVSYWQQIESKVTALPFDKEYEGHTLQKEILTITTTFNQEETQALLKGIHHAYGTEVNDILLSALGMTLREFINNPYFVIGMEGHGREDLFDRMDLSRTVGWFTSVYPVLLNTSKSLESIGDLIVETKEHLRNIPNRGIGYGILKHLTESPEKKGPLTAKIYHLIFNYLGDFDASIDGKDQNFIQFSKSDMGLTVSPENENEVGIEVEGLTLNGELHITWRYDSNRYKANTIQSLSNDFMMNLQEIVEHCQSISETIKTPSDYGLSGIADFSELQSFTKASHPYTLENVYRLSPLQEGILFHSLYEEKEGYLCQMSIDFKGQIDIDIFKRAWSHIGKQYSVLRTAFRADVFRIPIQCVYKDIQIPISELNFAGLSETDAQKKSKEFLLEDQNVSFNLSIPPLVRLSVIHLPNNKTKVVITNHHLIWDGWSLPIVLGSWIKTYIKISKSEELPTITEDSYKDFITAIYRKNEHEQQSFWRKYIANLEVPCFLPFVSDATERNKAFGNTLDGLELDQALIEKLSKYADKYQITINTVIQGAWSYLLSKYTGQSTIAFGATISGRNVPISNVEERVGLYINTIPVVSTLREEKSLTEWLQELQRDHTSAREDYSYLPLSTIQELTPFQEALFDTLLVFENYPVDKDAFQDSEGLELERVEVYENTNFVITLIVTATEETIEMDFGYNDDIITEETIAMIQGHLVTVLTSMAEEAQNLGEITFITNEEQAALTTLNDTQRTFSDHTSVLGLVGENVLKSPDSTALCFEEEVVSYRTLAEHVDQLALYLIAQGLKKEELVPICMNRSVDMIVSILAVMKAGGAYVPIDPAFPKSRIQYMLEDTGAKLILSSSAHEAMLAVNQDVSILLLDRLNLTDEVTKNYQLPDIEHDQLAYVFYTSGTTGNPKGVMIEHHALINFIQSMNELLTIEPKNRFLAVTTFTFDISLLEFFIPLSTGGTLILCNDQATKDPEELITVIEKARPTHIQTTPSRWQLLMDAGWKNTIQSTILAGGEALTESIKTGLVNRSTGPIWNLYGPTETTIWSCIKELDHTTKVTIGKPIANTTVYITDANMNLLPMGVVGELCIGGDGLSRGYLNRETLTQEKFVRNRSNPAERLYKTGDLAQLLPNGDIAYVGRADSQVKVRGFRIELGEIEVALEQLWAVKQAVAVVENDPQGHAQLVAHIISHDTFAPVELQQELRTKLPEYMVPSFFIEHEEFPLNSNGKIDRKKLPGIQNATLGTNMVSAETTTEKDLLVIWSNVLAIDEKHIGVTSSFFELGGNSIKAFHLVSAIKKHFGKKIALRIVFEKLTIRELSTYIDTLDSNTNKAPASSKKVLAPASSAQQRMFYYHLMDTENLHFNISGGIYIHGNLDMDRVKNALQQLINRHASLRTGFEFTDAGIVQRVYSQATIHFEELSKENNLREAFTKFVTPFNLVEDTSLIKSGLYPITENKHALFINLHHIICDGVSLHILLKDLIAFYKGESLHPLSHNYTDYSLWQQSLNGHLDSQKQYWQEQLAGELTEIVLPTEASLIVDQETLTDVEVLKIEGGLYHQLKAFSKDREVSNFILFTTAFYLLLSRVTGTEDIIIGTDAIGRTNDAFHDIIGTFVNILPLRMQIKSTNQVDVLLEQVKNLVLDAYEHQDFQFDEIVKLKYENQQTNHLPIVQFHFRFIDHVETHFKFNVDDVVFESMVIEGDEHAHYKLQIDAMEVEDAFQLKFVYNKNLYDAQLITYLTSYYQAILETISGDKKLTVKDLQN